MMHKYDKCMLTVKECNSKSCTQVKKCLISIHQFPSCCQFSVPLQFLEKKGALFALVGSYVLYDYRVFVCLTLKYGSKRHFRPIF